MTGRRFKCVVGVLAVAASVVPLSGRAAEKKAGLEPRAEQALRRMSHFLAEQPRLSVQASARLEADSETYSRAAAGAH